MPKRTASGARSLVTESAATSRPTGVGTDMPRRRPPRGPRRPRRLHPTRSAHRSRSLDLSSVPPHRARRRGVQPRRRKRGVQLRESANAGPVVALPPYRLALPRLGSSDPLRPMPLGRPLLNRVPSHRARRLLRRAHPPSTKRRLRSAARAVAPSAHVCLSPFRASQSHPRPAG